MIMKMTVWERGRLFFILSGRVQANNYEQTFGLLPQSI